MQHCIHSLVSRVFGLENQGLNGRPVHHPPRTLSSGPPFSQPSPQQDAGTIWKLYFSPSIPVQGFLIICHDKRSNLLDGRLPHAFFSTLLASLDVSLGLSHFSFSLGFIVYYSLFSFSLLSLLACRAGNRFYNTRYLAHRS